MHGFKSFAEPVVIEFDKGITCIVGPNGSGKSNISDAIRWVLGEQSPKMLRGGKMEEVIFSGTDSRKSRGMAEVTLVIDNENGSLPIDYKEVAITRCMFRSGESEYRINGNQCRLRDIRDLIMDTGIGVDGYSIIGQGKISDILSNKTDSRREIFEEAAGIVMYRTKKAESERKLASTSSNMERVNDIIGELEGRIGGLAEDSRKAKEYLELRDRYKELEINITLKNIENLESKNNYIKEDLAELKLLIDECSDRKTELERALAENGSRNQALEELAAETQEKLLTAIDELNSAVNKGQVDREKLASIEVSTARLSEEIRQLEQKYDKEKLSQSEFREKKAQIDRKFAEASDTLHEKTELYDTAAGELAAIAAQADRYKSDIFELTASVSSGRAEISSLERLQETLEKRQESLLREKSSGDDSSKETIDRLNRIKGQREQLQQELSAVKEQVAGQKSASVQAGLRERELVKIVEDLRLSQGQLSSRMKTIEEMESNYEGYNYAVKHVMKSGLRGIRGVVADLIKVPAGYETAMETALGAALQNVVCDDDSSAKAAIRSLKENRAGRMTFLPVSSVNGRAFRNGRLEREPGFVGFGPDCLEYDRQYSGIIDYLLGRVVIVDNMDNALRMSKSGAEFRFVTLDGEVINARGAITGGKYRNKTANILDRKAEIGSLRNQIREKSEAIQRHEAELTQVRETVSRAADRITELEAELREKEQQDFSMESEIRMIETMLRDIRSGSDRLERELANIEAEKQNSRKMIRELEDGIEADEKAAQDAEKLAEEQRELYEKQKSSFDDISEEITAARIEVNSCEREKEHVDSMADRITASLNELEADITARQTELADMENEKVRIISESGNTDTAVREKESEKLRLETYLSELAAEKSRLGETTAELNAEKESISSRLGSVQDQKYELEIKNAKNETQLDTYKNRLWEDFGVSYIQAMEFRSSEFVMSMAVKESRQIRNRMRELGEVNVGAIEEYETVKERYDFLASQRADIQEAVDSLTGMIADMDKTIRVKFKESFDQIVVNFENKFKELFGGGHAELRLSDEKDPLSSDIDIVAQPPGKRLQNINLLSGGEKTLTAIALMFAVLEAKPTPFCILDEVEAALDDANIDRFINCLRKFSGIQFTLVTHQKATMEHADALYGVTMPEKGVSKVLSLSFDNDFEL